MQNYSEAQQFLYSLSNLPRAEYMKSKKKCAVYMERMQLFLNILGNPEKNITHFVHIAGTSGKGSVGTFLQSILHTHGKTTGLFVSPHPTTITERWKIGNKHMTKKEFVLIMQDIKQALDTYIKKTDLATPSFFEVTTAIGLYWFAQKKAEYVILEAGCGGQFDSTNIIPKKDLAIITNIGLDHTHILGKTKREICNAKSGIITKNTKHCITAEKSKPLIAIMQKAAKKYKKNLHLSKPKAEILYSGIDATEFAYADGYYTIQALGKHQVANAILAIDSAELLKIPQSDIMSGLQNATQPLRMQVVQSKPTIILDSAHNVDKMKTSVDTLQKLDISGIHLVLGFCANKDISKMLKLLNTLQPKSIACTRNTVNSFRKVITPSELQKLCKKYVPKAKIETFIDPQDALIWSKKQAKSTETILCTGSIFVSGQLTA